MDSLKSMKYHILLWQFCGLWPPKNNPNWYRIYGFIFNLIFFILFPLSLIMKLFFVDNFNELIETMLPCFSVALASVKGFNVFMKQIKFFELFDVMRKLDVAIQTTEQRIILKNVLNSSQNLFNLSCFFYVLSLNSAFIAVFRSDERILMWPSWYPFDWKTNDYIYYTILMYQYISNFFVVLIDSSVDSYGAGLNNVLGGHIDILGVRLKNVHSNALNVDGKIKSSTLKSNNDAVTINRSSPFIKCIEDHKLCYIFSSLLDDILSMAYLVQFSISGLVLCVTTFQLSVISPLENFSKFWFVISYLICMTLEIFLPCYFGTVVTIKSAQLTYNVYESNWIEQTNTFKKSMNIFVERSLKPIRPFVGGLFLLGLPTFVSILRSAYSLLALLKNIQHEYN